MEGWRGCLTSGSVMVVIAYADDVQVAPLGDFGTLGEYLDTLTGFQCRITRGPMSVQAGRYTVQQRGAGTQLGECRATQLVIPMPLDGGEAIRKLIERDLR